MPDLDKRRTSLRKAFLQVGKTFATVKEVLAALGWPDDSKSGNPRLANMLDNNAPLYDIYTEITQKGLWGSCRWRGRNIGLLSVKARRPPTEAEGKLWV